MTAWLRAPPQAAPMSPRPLGRLLLLRSQPLHDGDGHGVRGVDGRHAVGAEEREPGDAEECVEDVGLVARLVGDAAACAVKTRRDR